MTDQRGKRPAYQWYPGDWRRDTALQACSFEARALWREMLDLMHDGEPYGHLTAGGVPITDEQLARIVGVKAPKVRRWLTELDERKVFSRTERGVIYSRRMVKDEATRNARALGGPRSLDNPNVPRRKDPEKDGHKDTLPPSSPESNAPSPAVATADCSLQSAIEPVVTTDARQRFVAAANKGLAEHPTKPQPIPRIIASSAKSYEATSVIRTAGVPIEFAEAEIYRLAKEHNADGQVTSLNYFANGVCRAWERENAKSAAERSRPNSGRPSKSPLQHLGHSTAVSNSNNAAAKLLGG